MSQVLSPSKKRSFLLKPQEDIEGNVELDDDVLNECSGSSSEHLLQLA